MHITITWFQGKYPSFNLGLHSTPESEEFLSIKGCKIFDGEKGSFVSYPSTKKADGKYWNHCWGSKAFNDVILKKALATRPAAIPTPPQQVGIGNSDPFADTMAF